VHEVELDEHLILPRRLGLLDGRREERAQLGVVAGFEAGSA